MLKLLNTKKSSKLKP